MFIGQLTEISIAYIYHNNSSGKDIGFPENKANPDENFKTQKKMH